MLCHQVPSALTVMHHLGMFYYWHVWNVVPTLGRIVCKS